MVLIGHFHNIEWLWEDRLGVDIFFVLSGMLMSKILFEQRISLKRFYIRRISRILPVFFAYVLVIYLLSVLARFEFSPSEVLATLTFMRTYVPDSPHIFETKVAVGHLWSLNVEEHAYVIMSVMTLVFLTIRRSAWALLIGGMISIAVCFYYYFDAEIKDPYFYIRTECALSFIFLSAGYNLLRTEHEIVAPAFLPLISLLLASACYINAAPQWVTFSLSPILLAIAVNHLRDLRGLTYKVLDWKPLRLLGLYSYSIYLWQQPFYRYHDLLPGGKFSGLVLALLAGYLSFKLFENPVREWINNRWAA